ncbi:TadE/TadG family type IV pilus assembly protein [Hamadaea sp. NPDC050747]|uniref:TadE/TadG family type IV pilus assembly protein n=1 Tax=Hamadaea sp. NPDC050747 TaxID=3155789 RepID=UPI0033C66614
MNPKKMRRSRHSDRGAAAVETALLVPVLLLILFGVIDFGRLLNAQITLTEAAREAARSQTLNPTDNRATNASTAQSRANLLAQNIGTVTVNSGASSFCTPSAGAGDDAKVVLSHQFKWVTPVGALGSFFGGGGYGANLDLSATGVMPCRA